MPGILHYSTFILNLLLPHIHACISCREYRTIPHLDTYEGENLDDAAYDEMSPSTRTAAEKELRKRDRQEALASGRMRPGLLYEESEGEEDMGAPAARRRRMTGETEDGMEFEEV